ncbi:MULTISPECIES: SRPBCC family protein [unclassified Phenylobacterium]|uniref:SRPBCC family protein n=1 Tax=unclassified Phenylobacterium TaxID=2640670 RepID=UPI00226512A8|nr:SRPBCC domain-containing protein [Phenylobacterium sp. 58.2.17]MBS0488445.1 SRPBCC domain-containing protein [Pseudomonadota bacterium]MCX7586668.1 SRPBCC domain-containing protein [Phenylobacterium sp. 58.2.17]
MTPATDTAVLQDDELLIERIFDAPPDLVFRVWTSPEHLMRWWGPKDFVTVVFDQDFRVGGAYRACIRDASGGDHWMTGTYREIVDGQKIVMSFRWEDGAWGVDNTVTVMFAALAGGRTLFRFHQAPFASLEARDSHTQGWSSLVDKLAVYLDTEDAR